MTFTTTLSPPMSITGGQDIGIFPVPSELTVAQAARILDMSEACLDDMLDDGIIESHWVNGIRLVQEDSLLAFDTRYREGCAVLAELAQWGQEVGDYD